MLPTMSHTHWYSTRATGTPKSLISKTISFRFLRTLADGWDCLGFAIGFVVVFGFDFSSFVVAFVVVVVAVVTFVAFTESAGFKPSFMSFFIVVGIWFSSLGWAFTGFSGDFCGCPSGDFWGCPSADFWGFGSGGRDGRSQRWRRCRYTASTRWTRRFTYFVVVRSTIEGALMQSLPPNSHTYKEYYWKHK